MFARFHPLPLLPNIIYIIPNIIFLILSLLHTLLLLLISTTKANRFYLGTPPKKSLIISFFSFTIINTVVNRNGFTPVFEVLAIKFQNVQVVEKAIDLWEARGPLFIFFRQDRGFEPLFNLNLKCLRCSQENN